MTVYDTNLASLITWADIRPDDQKMMFCARQAAQLILPEHFAELKEAAAILGILDARVYCGFRDTCRKTRDRAELIELSQLFNSMILFSIRDCSRMADILGVDGVDGVDEASMSRATS